MSQAATMPKLQSARALQKARHIKKVKAAIKWHERARKQRQTVMRERFESKDNALLHQRWQKEQVRDVRSRALENAKEDWMLGPLRPNRAIGEEAATYGALDREAIRRPPVPVRVLKTRNETREKKGLELEYPIIVDDAKYFPIAEGDRVVIMKGREKNKIGVVHSVIEDSHEILIKGLNMHYAESRIFDIMDKERAAPKRETEVGIPMSDVRLVIPYQMTVQKPRADDPSTFTTQDVTKDVIVDKIVMERHKTGIDPFTGIDHGNSEFPEEHRFNPENGLPLFHRYIAGTRQRIEWPWEKAKQGDVARTTKKRPANKGVRSKITKGIGYITSPVKTLRSYMNKRPASKQGTRNAAQELQATKERNAEQEARELYTSDPPRTQDPKLPGEVDMVDTMRTTVEHAEDIQYNLVYPPHPLSLDELRPELRMAEKNRREHSDEENPLRTTRMVERQAQLAKQSLMEQRKKDAMKTPMQIRWELEQARKQAEGPKVSTEALLLALGQHMEKNGVKGSSKRNKSKVAEKPVDDVE